MNKQFARYEVVKKKFKSAESFGHYAKLTNVMRRNLIEKAEEMRIV